MASMVALAPTASSIAAAPAEPAPAGLTLAGFMAASESITGKTGLDAEFGAALFEALKADQASAAALGALIEQRTAMRSGDGVTAAHVQAADLHAALSALESRIRSAWYSGSDGPPVAYTYLGALCWRAVPFARPPGICGEAMGDWAKAPG